MNFPLDCKPKTFYTVYSPLTIVSFADKLGILIHILYTDGLKG